MEAEGNQVLAKLSEELRGLSHAGAGDAGAVLVGDVGTVARNAIIARQANDMRSRLTGRWRVGRP